MSTQTLSTKPTEGWTSTGPQLQAETLSDGSKVFNVIISEETIFCVDEKHALQLIEDLNAAVQKAV